jgi:hypothetical protein
MVRKPIGNLVISLRLSPDDREALERVCVRLGIPRAEALRTGLTLLALALDCVPGATVAAVDDLGELIQDAATSLRRTVARAESQKRAARMRLPHRA